MTRVPFWNRWWVQSTTALVVAILVSAVTHWLRWTLSLKEDLVFVVGIWVVTMIFQIAYSLHSFHVDRLETKYILGVIDENDRSLLELQHRLREIASKTLSGKPNSVFINYCRRSLKQSLDIASRAAQRGELEVRDHHFNTIDTVLAAFDGCRDRTFRCVWLIEAGECLFDEFWRQYMQSVVELSRHRHKKQRVQVQILFVLEDQAQLERTSVKTVLGFVSTEKGFEYQLIRQNDYESRLSDAHLDKQYLDFGIYGDHLLFRTTSYEPNVGVFSDDQTAINTYREMHDTAMNAAETVKIPRGLPERVSLEQFLDCDSADPVSEATAERRVEQ